MSSLRYTQNPYFRADLGDPITPAALASAIKGPVFTACAWQDEQTGPFSTPCSAASLPARLCA